MDSSNTNSLATLTNAILDAMYCPSVLNCFSPHRVDKVLRDDYLHCCAWCTSRCPRFFPKGPCTHIGSPLWSQKFEQTSTCVPMPFLPPPPPPLPNKPLPGSTYPPPIIVKPPFKRPDKHGISTSVVNNYGDGTVTTDQTTSPQTSASMGSGSGPSPFNSSVPARKDPIPTVTKPNASSTKPNAKPHKPTHVVHKPHYKVSPTSRHGNQFTERLTHVTAGNTAMSSLGGQATEVHTWAPPPEPAHSYSVDVPMIPEDPTDRRFDCGPVTWSPSNYNASIIYLDDCISALNKCPDNLFQRVIAQHRIMSCDFRVQVVFNPSQMMSGCLALTGTPDFIPVVSEGSAPYNNSINTFNLSPTSFLNLRSDTQATLDLNFVYHNSSAEVDSYSSPAIYLTVISALYSPTGGTQNLQGRIYITPMNLRVHALSYSRPKKGMTEMGLSLARRSDATRAQPKKQVGDNLRVLAVNSEFLSSNLMPGQEVPFTVGAGAAPSPDYLPGEVTSLLEIFKTPQIIRTLSWNSASPAGTRLVTLPISFGLNSSVWARSSLQLVNLFAQWRGSVDISLKFTGSAFHRGRLGFCFTPLEDTAPATMELAQLGMWQVSDVSLASDYHFNAPYLSPHPWSTTVFPGIVSGTVSIWIVDPLTYIPGTATEVGLLVFASVGEDFDVRRFRNPPVYQGDPDPGSALDLAPPASEDVSVTTVPAAIVDSNPTNPDQSHLIKNYFALYRPTHNYNVEREKVITIHINPLELRPQLSATTSQIANLLSTFSYFRADLSVQFHFVPFASVGTDLNVANICYAPPGEIAENTTGFGANTPSASYGAPTDTAWTATLFIPYSSPTAVIPVTPRYVRRNHNLLTYPYECAMGSFSFRSRCPGHLSVAVSFRNMRVWVPNSIQYIPSPASSIDDVEIPPDFDAVAMAEPESPVDFESVTNSEEFTSQLNVKRPDRHGPPAGGDFETLSLLSNNNPVYVVVCETQYKHWALRCGDRQISITRQGLRAYIALEPCSGEVHCEVTPPAWYNACVMLGEEFVNYSATNNCTHFVMSLTGLDLPNTGTAATLGLVAVGVVAAAAAMIIKPQKHMFAAAKKTVGDVGETAVKTATTLNRMERTLDGTVPHVVSAAGSISAAATSAAHTAEAFAALADPARAALVGAAYASNSVSDTAAQFSQVATSATAALTSLTSVTEGIGKPFGDAATSTADAMNTFKASVEKLTPPLAESLTSIAESLRSATSSMPSVYTAMDKVTELMEGAGKTLAKTICSTICKVVAILLILFGSPTLVTFAGITLLLTAMAIDHGGVFTSLSTLLKKLTGLRIRPEPVRELIATFTKDSEVVQFLEPEDLPPAPTKQGVKNFNDGVNAVRNSEWLFSRGVALVQGFLNLFKTEIERDPYTHLVNQQSKIDSIVRFTNDAFTSPTPPTIAECDDNMAKMVEFRRIAHTIEGSNPFIGPINTVITKLLQARTMILRAKALNRPQPIVVYLCGAPGTGKSIAASVLAPALARALGSDPRTGVYTKPCSSDYWDGYTGQDVVVIDDLGQDPSGADYMNFLQLCSPTPVRLNMAGVEEKGRLFTSRIIIVTTNFENANPAAFRDASAFLRRLIFRGSIEPTPQYAVGGKLNIGAALQDVGPTNNKNFAHDTPLMNGTAARFVPCQNNPLTITVNGKVVTSNNPVSLITLFNLILHKVNIFGDVGTSLQNLVYHAGEEDGWGDPIPAVLTANQLCDNITNFVNGDEVDQFVNPNYDCSGIGICKTCYSLHCPGQNGGMCASCPKCHSLTCVCEVSEIILTPIPEPCKTGLFTHEEFQKSPWYSAPWTFIKSHWRDVLSFILIAINLVVLAAAGVKLYMNFGPGMPLASTLPWNNPDSQAPYSGIRPKWGKKKAEKHGPRSGMGDLIKKLTASTTPLVMSDQSLTATCVWDRYYVFNAHAFENSPRLSILGQPFTAAQCSFKGDLAMVHLPMLRPGIDLRRYFVDSPTLCNGKRGILLVNSNKYTTTAIATNITYVPSMETSDGQSDTDILQYTAGVAKGFCGAPLLVVFPDCLRVAGIHYAGYTGIQGFALTFSRVTLSEMAARLPIPVAKHGIITSREAGPNVFINRNTRLTPSPAAGAFPLLKEPAVLRQSDPRLNPDLSLDAVMFSKFTGDITKPWRNLRAAVDLYLTSALWDYKHSELSIEQAINGIPYLEPLDMNQSSGFPWCASGVSRRSLFTRDGENWVPIGELTDAIEATRRDPNVLPFCTFLKDELRPVTKIASGKTRLVDCSPLPHAILMRSLFGTLYAHYHRHNGTRVGSAVGCNPDVDWTRYFQSFQSFENVYDLDYSGFDGSIPSCMYHLVADWMAAHGFSSDAVTALRTLSTTRRLYAGSIYTVDGTMASGVSGTSIFNSIFNNCFILSALMDHPDFDPDTYRVLAYGDDVIYAHDPPIDPTHIKTFFDEHTCLKVTPASKMGEFNTRSTIFDVTFLKRRFVPDESTTVYIHPVIDPDTYEQSVMWLREGEFSDVVRSLSYLAWHAGETAYRAWSDRICATVREAHLEPPVILPYAFLRAMWLNSLDYDLD
ncbi:polyprotein [symapivirus A1]|uniref:Genome polyprotein n=1 Tax=symapivirus A1 TaxID=3126012 RepID=A0A2P1GN62_9PICO|nr:polyprotein [Wenling triplecross lizardfish picornavirus]AVM87408.1 polyprotein [Wenling triplecross lizardfish picornavirus]